MNDAAVQCNLIKALGSWKEASFKAFKCGSEISYSLSLLSSQAYPCHLCQLGEQRFLDSSLLLSKESKMIGDEILKLLAWDQAPMLLICLPPPAERLILRERLGGVTVNAATDCFSSTDEK